MTAVQLQALRQLLALCTQSENSPLPSGDAEWNSLLPLALSHGVAPLLFANLRERVLPVPARDQLRHVFLSNSIRNEKLLAEQQRIFDAFSKKSLAVWPLKGPHLSQTLYGDPAVRQVADLDLLIRPIDLAACDELLQSSGYTRQAHGDIASLRDAGELIYLRSAPDAAATINFAVDLQQRVLPYGRRDPLADRIRAQNLTPENLLLLLCVNQIAHRFARLKYLLDVAACLRALPANFDWNEFIASAQFLSFTPGIYWSLYWAREAAGAPVPEHVLEELRPSWFSRWLASRALGDDPLSPLARGAALDGPAGAWAILACSRAGLPRLALFWRMLFPSSATLRQEFFDAPGRSILYLYLIRLARKLPAALRRHS